eukprot:TRINITY_DN28121_c0_g1_i1.p1 TRINITY_DN28121_c0_g1~~TRINITY_DN28121_c0_g1_i1.p1  ORF type:complete len:103 (+),score=16.80 TRINITY_DN28121_c0_g1_i1:112-420(+)
MIRRPPRSTLSSSSAASDVYKRQIQTVQMQCNMLMLSWAVSYTHLRAHETPEHLVCRLLLEKKKGYLIREPKMTKLFSTNRTRPQRKRSRIKTSTSEKKREQ